MNIEMRHLRYFVAVAEEASFTAAAQRVHVAQQVLSTQIRQLEDAVGCELLRRTSRGVALTAAGSAFLGFARETLASLDRGVAAARNAASAVSGQLTVGLQAATGGSGRTRVLAAFERAYPEVALRLVSYDLAQPAAGLLDHSSDVALLRPPVDAPGILVEQVSAEPRVFVLLPAGHPLASRPVLELADVAGRPWVAAPLSVDGCAPARFRDDWLVVPRPGGDVPVIGAVAPRSRSGASTSRPGAASACAPRRRRRSAPGRASCSCLLAAFGLPRCAWPGGPTTCGPRCSRSSRWLPAAWLPAAWLPAAWLPAAWLPAAWRTLRGRKPARVGRDGTSRSSCPASARAGQHLSRIVSQLAGVTAAPAQLLPYRKRIRDPLLSWVVTALIETVAQLSWLARHDLVAPGAAPARCWLRP